MGKCLICRLDAKPLLKSPTDSDQDDPAEMTEIYRSWAKTCVNSLCTLIKIPDFQFLFLNANYCEACLQLIRDIDFSLQQINNLQKQMLGFRDHLFTQLGQNYETAVGITEILSFDEKVKFLYKKINEKSKSWTSTDFMDSEAPKNPQRIRNVLEVVRIEVNDKNKPMEFHEEETAEEFMLFSNPQEDNYKEKEEVNKAIEDVIKEELVIEQDMDLNEDNHIDLRCFENVQIPELVFQPRNILDDIKIEPIEIPKDETNTKANNDSRARRKQKLISFKELDEIIKTGVSREQPSEDEDEESKDIPEEIDPDWQSSDSRPRRKQNFVSYIDKIIKSNAAIIKEEASGESKRIVEEIDPDWESSDAESVNKDEDHFALGPAKKTTRPPRGTEGNKDFLCKAPSCGRGFDLESALLIHQVKVHEGDSTPFHCKLCDEKFKRNAFLTTHMNRAHSGIKCSFCGLEFKTEEEQNEHENVHKNSDQPFKCTFSNCDQVLTNSTALKKHMFIHVDKRISKCDVCGKHFKSAQSLTEHQKIHDDSFVGFPCTVCNKMCAHSSSLALHMTSHSDDRKHKCDVCGAAFKLKSTLNNHKKIHSEAKLICQICGKKFRLHQQLRFHEETHSGTMAHECKTCGKKFAVRSRLLFHEKTHEPKDPNKTKRIRKNRLYHCEVCNKTLSSSANYSKHKKIHRNKAASCTECDKEFKSEESLKIHMDKVHLSMKCAFCGMELETKEKLDEHENIHKNNPKPFSCTICDEVYTKSATLKQHMLTHDEGRPICDVCGKNFRSLKYLRMHRKLHHDDSFVGHPCTVCNKKLLTPFDLTRHMETHSDERKYICDVCGETFKQNMGLRRHKRKHDGDLKFVCQFCGKAFISSSFLTNHEEIHSGTLSYECKICNKKFRGRNNLEQHKKTHEPKDPNRKKRIRTNSTKLSSQAKKIKAKSSRNQDSSSSECESEEESDHSIEEDTKKSNQDHIPERVQIPQYPSTSTQIFRPDYYYNMPHSNFQYPPQ